jgi:hypothetical protein
MSRTRAGLVLQEYMNITAEQTMPEIWGAFSPDCGPENFDFHRSGCIDEGYRSRADSAR